jgi:hypothetical protein
MISNEYNPSTSNNFGGEGFSFLATDPVQDKKSWTRLKPWGQIVISNILLQ